MQSVIRPLIFSALLCVLTLMSGCEQESESAPTHTSPYQISVSHHSAFDLNQASLKVTLYGTHKYVADNTATVIATSEHTLTQLPRTITARWPDDAYRLIQNPPVDHPNEATYYLVISIDGNRDKQLCPGDDYQQDYAATPFFTLSGRPEASVEMTVKPIETGICQGF